MSSRYVVLSATPLGEPISVTEAYRVAKALGLNPPEPTPGETHFEFADRLPDHKFRLLRLLNLWAQRHRDRYGKPEILEADDSATDEEIRRLEQQWLDDCRAVGYAELGPIPFMRKSELAEVFDHPSYCGPDWTFKNQPKTSPKS